LAQKYAKKFTFASKKNGMLFEIQLPDNKSISIRRMVSAYVRGAEIPTVKETDARDVRVTYRALCTLRKACEEVHASAIRQPVVLDVVDCGAAYRFLMPLLAATPGNWLLTGTTHLLQRPIEPLVKALCNIGAEISRMDKGWTIQGKILKSEELSIDASHSSQLASALVLAAPLLGLKRLRLTTLDIPSLSYLRMTLACTQDWPVEIPGVDLPDGPIGALGDWSAALFWFAHACLHPENGYKLSPLTVDSIQNDSVIYQWFSELNLSISIEDSSIVLRSKPLTRIPRVELDMRDNLDAVPVMAALAALLPADVTFRNVRNLRYKESDRLEALSSQLALFAEIECTENELHVNGHGLPKGVHPVFDTHHDHRLAMAFLLFGPSAELNDISCLEKSYPGLLSFVSQI